MVDKKMPHTPSFSSSDAVKEVHHHHHSGGKNFSSAMFSMQLDHNGGGGGGGANSRSKVPTLLKVGKIGVGLGVLVFLAPILYLMVNSLGTSLGIIDKPRAQKIYRPSTEEMNSKVGFFERTFCAGPKKSMFCD